MKRGPNASFFKRLKYWLDQYQRVLLLLVSITGLFILHHYWYSFSVTGDLKFADDPKVLVLSKQETIIVVRGALREQYLYRLEAGEYIEILRNADGSFYLAPEMGFFKTSTPEDGFAVGGIYVPSEEGEFYYIWEWPLKNRNRSMQNPTVARVLSADYDQPERKLFLNPTWYETKDYEILGSPLIDKGLEIPKTRVRGP